MSEVLSSRHAQRNRFDFKAFSLDVWGEEWMEEGSSEEESKQMRRGGFSNLDIP